jgi:radical SAM-linked protein
VIVRVRILFRKEQGARFLSHLDLMATFEYALRRAKLPVELSEGFNPRPRISLAAPLALGHVGEAEILELPLQEPMGLVEVRDGLQAALPSGINITSVEEMQGAEKLSATRLRAAVYRIDLHDDVPDLETRIYQLLQEESLPVTEDRKDGPRKRDLRPLIVQLTPDNDKRSLRAEVRMDTEGSVRPEQLLELLNIELMGVRITRECLLLRD